MTSDAEKVLARFLEIRLWPEREDMTHNEACRIVITRTGFVFKVWRRDCVTHLPRVNETYWDV